MLFCQWNISLNIITCSATRLRATELKVIGHKFAHVPSNTIHLEWNSEKSVWVCLPWEEKNLSSVNFNLITSQTGWSKSKTTSQDWISTGLWLVFYPLVSSPVYAVCINYTIWLKGEHLPKIRKSYGFVIKKQRHYLSSPLPEFGISIWK